MKGQGQKCGLCCHIAVNPLMHWTACPSPTFRMYCITKEKESQFQILQQEYQTGVVWLIRIKSLECDNGEGITPALVLA